VTPWAKAHSAGIAVQRMMAVLLPKTFTGMLLKFGGQFPGYRIFEGRYLFGRAGLVYSA